jgi:hypothetical protein
MFPQAHAAPLATEDEHQTHAEIAAARHRQPCMVPLTGADGPLAHEAGLFQEQFRAEVVEAPCCKVPLPRTRMRRIFFVSRNVSKGQDPSADASRPAARIEPKASVQKS